MRKVTLVVLGAAVAVIASIGVIGAQHQEGGASHMAASQHPAQFFHAFCAPAAGAHATAGDAAAHIPADIAKALALTSAQQAELTQMGTEACAEITRIHERMMAVLTEEQRAKMHELHKGGGHGDHPVMSWLKKLHGI